jgi:hypothetical protein
MFNGIISNTHHNTLNEHEESVTKVFSLNSGL